MNEHTRLTISPACIKMEALDKATLLKSQYQEVPEEELMTEIQLPIKE